MKHKNKSISSLLAISSVLFLINWASETNVNGTTKHSVNFRGKIITHQGKEYIIDNISIANKFKQIPIYDLPGKYEPAQLNPDTKQTEVKIDTTVDLITSKIDLNESNEIRVPHPDIVWIQEKKGHHRKEFLEIEIISNVSKTKRSYLLEKNTKITCDELDLAGPIEKQIPLSTVKQLVIESYSYRHSKNNEKKE